MQRRKLREARAKKHWTLERATEEIGVGVNSLNLWELGKTTPYAVNIQRVCEVYGATATDLDLEDSASRGNRSGLLQHDPFTQSDLTMRLMALAFVPHRRLQDVQNSLSVIIEESNMNKDEGCN